MADTDSATSEIVSRMRADLNDAVRQRDQVRMDTIRMALDGFTQAEVARNRAALSEQDRVAILDKQVKQRMESADIFQNAGRPELAEKETRQADILKSYMPSRLSDAEVREMVAGIIAEHGKEFRTVMPLASKTTRGRADGKRVSEIVREMTA
ncbi:MAG TPA: GatB/YqeY domain-containing protein [Ktedonobacterales bacterium]|nr:GatB/YqeY domain-containing protein [Ktedonobacterales bacterium]